MRRKLINFIKRILGKYGLKIISIKHAYPIFIDIGKLSPIEISYLLHKDSILIKAETNKGRGGPVNSFGNKGNHPFSFAVYMSKHLPEDEQYNKIYEILDIYYTKVKPSSAGVLANASKGSLLYNYPSWSMVMPWNSENILEWEKNTRQSVLHENLKENVKFGIEKGFSWIGPTDNEKLTIEATRLAKILQSIQKHGYKRNDGEDGDIRADLLIDEQGNWVWQTVVGQHRAAVLSGLGWDMVPIRVNRIIRKQDVEFWPNVTNGTYSVQEALNIFNMIFNGCFSHFTSSWDDYINVQNRENEI